MVASFATRTLHGPSRNELKRPRTVATEPFVSDKRKTTKSEPPREASWTLRRPPAALLVDDAFDSRDMYGEMLRQDGYRVLEACDGADALGVALGQHPDIIVMDLCMPRMDGWEAVRRLKADPRTRSIPVVVLTALGRERGAVEVECDAYLVKPCLPFDLLGVLDALLAEAEPDGRST
jgi:two-component system cell cycle response regulator DivK